MLIFLSVSDFEPILYRKMRKLSQTLSSYLLLSAGLAIAGYSTPTLAAEGLATAREIYPQTVADLERQCLSPATLSTQTYTNSLGGQMVSFICWSAAGESGSRTGQWLGRLPITAVESFGESLTCKPEDELCDRWLPILQSQYPTALQEAEFQCAIRNGVLLTQFSETSVAVRCGFFATTFYDENGDDMPDYEDPISVDIPVTTLPLTAAE